jgi:MFS family permease
VRHAVLAALCSLAFLTYLDRICIMRVQEDIARDLGFASLTRADEEALRGEGMENDAAAREKAGRDRATKRLSYVFAAFNVGYLIFEIPGGWLGDLWGPRRVIFRIVTWWSVFTALTGSVAAIAGLLTGRPEPTLYVVCLVVIRFLFGLGEAGAYPNISRAVSRWFPFRSRASAQGVIWLSSRFGGAVAPTFIGLLMMAFGGWQAAFWALGAVGIVWALWFRLWFRDRPEEKTSTNEAERELIRSGGMGSGSIYDDSHREVPWRRVLTSPNLWALYVAAACVGFSWYFNVTFLPGYLKDKYQVEFKESAWMSGLPLLAGGVSCFLGGALSDWLVRTTGSRRWGRSLPGVVGWTAAGVCVLLVPRAANAEQVIALLCLACAFQDLAIPCIWTVCADIGGRYAGTVAGAMNTLNNIGGALGLLVTGEIATAFGWQNAFYLFAASYVLGGLLWLQVDARERLAASEPREQAAPGDSPA